MCLLQKKVLYIIEGYTGFKKLDEKIIKSFAKTRTYNYRSVSDYLSFRIIYDMIWSDVIIMWFASKHSIPAILINLIFNKPLVIIAGGFDVASCPEIEYGAMRRGSRKKIGNWILSRAYKVISVSKSNHCEILRNTNVPSNKVKMVYNAIQKNNANSIKKKIQVLTVGEVNKETYLRKGLDRFIFLAKKLPNIQFYHIGKWKNVKSNSESDFFDYVKNISPKNIKYLGYLDEKDLIDFYIKSKVYIQLSRHEAFGVSVAEALSYYCIPIVYNTYALPEIIGNNGFIVDNMEEAIKKTKYALRINSFNINKKYLKKFSIENRKEALKNILSV